MDTFKPGDVVRLKSGKKNMVIDKIYNEENKDEFSPLINLEVVRGNINKGYLWCRWETDSVNDSHDWYNPVTVEKINKD